MPKIRMEGRMEQVKKGLTGLEAVVFAISMRREQLRFDQEQRFSQLENLIAVLLKGKGTIEIGDTSPQTSNPNTPIETSATRVIGKPLLIEDPTSLRKKIKMPNFDGTNPNRMESSHRAVS